MSLKNFGLNVFAYPLLLWTQTGNIAERKKKMSLTSTFKKAKNAKRRDDWLDKMKQQKNLFENTESGRQGGGEGEEEQ